MKKPETSRILPPFVCFAIITMALLFAILFKLGQIHHELVRRGPDRVTEICYPVWDVNVQPGATVVLKEEK